MIPAHSPCAVRLEMTTGRVKPAAMGTALLNILSAPSMYRAKERARRWPRTFAPASGVPAAASCHPSG